VKRFWLWGLLLWPAWAGAEVFVGEVHIAGNEPHTFAVLHSEQGQQFQLDGPLASQMWVLQGQRVKLEGDFSGNGLGPGFLPKLSVTKITKFEEDPP